MSPETCSNCSQLVLTALPTLPSALVRVFRSPSSYRDNSCQLQLHAVTKSQYAGGCLSGGARQGGSGLVFSKGPIESLEPTRHVSVLTNGEAIWTRPASSHRR